ncbi:MAG: UDP-N-acetylglucosamine 2-epimerase [Fulvivirga sp.]
MKRIAIVTGSRAEFGLLYWIIKKINDDSDFELHLLVTGMHLSSEFGLTYTDIEESGFKVSKKIEILLSSDTSVGISKSIGLGVISFSECYEQLSPDILLVLGDRFEIFAASIAAMVARIPIAHIHGGESTEGAIDESIRHSISKMSHLHFAATETYRQRIIQLGEDPERVFNVGSPALDNISNLKLLSKEEFEESLNFKLAKVNALVTFHPITLEKKATQQHFNELLNSISGFPELSVIFTKPNADTEGRVIIKMIDDFVKSNPQKYCGFVSLGQLRYLSALQYVDFVLGNSSSGLSEVPVFGIPTINIGDRQKGRIMPQSVINCEPLASSVTSAINRALDSKFLDKISNIQSPYGTGGSSEKIVEILRNTDLNQLLKKKFYDLE